MSHGYSPVQMLGGTIVPIPKIKGTSKLDNFRGITLGSILCKILEIIILSKYKDQLGTSNLQFGFKKQSSTANCTFMVQETKFQCSWQSCLCYTARCVQSVRPLRILYFI